MDWASAYLGCFVLGLAFVAISALVGKFGAGGDGHDGAGHDAGHADGDGSHGEAGGKVGLPLFSPTVLAVFVGMFGAGGLFLHKVLGITSPLIHAGGAAGISAVSGLAVAYMMMKLLTHAETNAMASHRELVGQVAQVVVAIKGEAVGQIAYVSGGTRQNLIAMGEPGSSFEEGQRVQVLSVASGVAKVGPLGSRPALEVAQISPESVGAPVEKTRVK